jgi:hypothetical protein
MSTRWKFRLAYVFLIAAAAALMVGLVATAHGKPRPKHAVLSARAQYLADKNPLVIVQTANTRVVRAVVGDKLFVMMFEKRGGVWFYSSSKRASELPD